LGIVKKKKGKDKGKQGDSGGEKKEKKNMISKKRLKG